MLPRLTDTSRLCMLRSFADPPAKDRLVFAPEAGLVDKRGAGSFSPRGKTMPLLRVDEP